MRASCLLLLLLMLLAPLGGAVELRVRLSQSSHELREQQLAATLSASRARAASSSRKRHDPSKECGGAGRVVFDAASNSSSCVCPLDLIPPQCDPHRPFACEWRRVSPPRSSCEQLDSESNADPVCLRVESTREEPLLFSYRLECRFTNRSGIPEPYPALDGFDYLQRRGASTWAMSREALAGEDVPQWQAIFKVFNFEFLSDLSGSLVVNLTRAQLEGSSDVVFALRLASLDLSRFVWGDRLYAEVSIYEPGTSYAWGLEVGSVDRVFVDFSDIDTSVSLEEPFPIAVPIALGVALLIAIIVIIVLLCCYKRRRKQKAA